MAEKKENLHKGHFKRLREKTELYNLDHFNDHQRLELLLSFVSIRKDVNEVAHRLINEFETLSNVMNADKHRLREVEGVTDRMAVFLSLLPHYFKYYKMNQENKQIISSIDAIVKYYGKSITHLRNEELMIVCLDRNFKAINTKIFIGMRRDVGLPLDEMIRFVLNCTAKGVILLHNHPSGMCQPSSEDIFSTERILKLLNAFSIDLLDHVIMTEENYCSFRELGILAQIYAKNNIDFKDSGTRYQYRR